jgi:hypothetical protein
MKIAFHCKAGLPSDICLLLASWQFYPFKTEISRKYNDTTNAVHTLQKTQSLSNTNTTHLSLLGQNSLFSVIPAQPTGTLCG